MQRISIIGTSCAGKSTLAQQLSLILHLSAIELDSLHWSPGWKAAEPQIFQDRVRTAANKERWVIDGNYTAVRDIVWEAADTIIWLDYSLPVIFARALRRSFHRLIFHTPCCNGNRESLAITFSKDSILLWVLQTYYMRRREFNALLPQLAGKKILIFKSPRETQRWLRSVTHANRS